MNSTEPEKDTEVFHDEHNDLDLKAVQQSGDQDKIIQALANEILPDVQLNTDPAFERALVRKLDRRLLLMMMG
jgi:hypothetical protein